MDQLSKGLAHCNTGKAASQSKFKLMQTPSNKSGLASRGEFLETLFRISIAAVCADDDEVH